HVGARAARGTTRRRAGEGAAAADHAQRGLLVRAPSGAGNLPHALRGSHRCPRRSTGRQPLPLRHLRRLRPRRLDRGPRPAVPRTAESRRLTPSRSPNHVYTAPPAPPPATWRAIVSAPLPLRRRVVLAPWFGRCSAPAPGRDLSVDITRRGED